MGKRHFATEQAKKNNYEYKQRYVEKNYKRITVQLKKSDGHEIINWLEEENRKGESYSSVAQKALRNYYEKSK